MGMNAAEYLHWKGFKVIGIQEWDGSVFNRNGIDVDKFKKHYQEHKSVHGYVDYVE